MRCLPAEDKGLAIDDVECVGEALQRITGPLLVSSDGSLDCQYVDSMIRAYKAARVVQDVRGGDIW